MTARLPRPHACIAVTVLVSAVSIVGMRAAGATVAPGSVVTWGANTYGQLGDGTVVLHHTPAAIAGLSSVVQIEGGREHGLARTADGSVYAWGWNRYGQAGTGSSAYQVRSPAPILTGDVDIGAGHYSSFAVKADGTLWAWGRNGQGQLGDGTTTTRRKPVRVTGLSSETVVQVAGGRDHAMSRTADGTVYTWGSNAYGSSGTGRTRRGRRRAPCRRSPTSSTSWPDGTTRSPSRRTGRSGPGAATVPARSGTATARNSRRPSASRRGSAPPPSSCPRSSRSAPARTTPWRSRPTERCTGGVRTVGVRWATAPRPRVGSP